MLINPFKVRLPTLEGTRILLESFGLTGFQYSDPKVPDRVWTLQFLLAPIQKRAIGGIRAKFMDTKGFVSFCNQRDLELLLGIARSGDRCPWLDAEYPEFGGPQWYGLCVDDDDLADDLHERELRLRQQMQEAYPQQYVGVLPPHMEMVRRIHNGSDYEELLVLLGDMDRRTGFAPDTRIETVEERWVSVEKSKLRWTEVDM